MPRDSCFNSNTTNLDLFSFVLWMHHIQILTPSNRCDRRPTVSLRASNRADLTVKCQGSCTLLCKALHSASNQFHRTEEKDIARVINFESPWVEGSRTDIELLDLPRSSDIGWLCVSCSHRCACIALRRICLPLTWCNSLKLCEYHSCKYREVVRSVVWSAADLLFEQESFPLNLA